MNPSPVPPSPDPRRPADGAPRPPSPGNLEQLLAERLAPEPPRPEFRGQLAARFLSGFGAEGAPGANPGEPLTAQALGGLEAQLGQRLREGLPAARPAFARELEQRFLSPAPLERTPDAHRALPRRQGPGPRLWRWAPVAAALAVAAGLLLWSSARGTSSGLRFEPIRAQGARYAGAPLEAPFVARAGQRLEVGADPLRLKLGDALRLFLAAGSQVEIEPPCALRSGCLETCLALEAEREAVVVTDERDHRVQVTLETAQARVVLFGAEASVKPCADGTCIVIQSGRARVEPRHGPALELTAGQRLFVGGDGRIDLDREYLTRQEDPAVVERVGNLRRSLAEVAEGVF